METRMLFDPNRVSSMSVIVNAIARTNIRKHGKNEAGHPELTIVFTLDPAINLVELHKLACELFPNARDV